DSIAFEFRFRGYATQEPNHVTEAHSALGQQLKGIESQQFNARAKSLPTQTTKQPLMRRHVR
ncbi:hypothetical protein C5P36_26410, partial [Escherichia coli]